jgi:hypothetical protein
MNIFEANKMPNKLVRSIVGGHWLKINPSLPNTPPFWFHPTFPNVTRVICDTIQEEKYFHSWFGKQSAISVH